MNRAFHVQSLLHLSDGSDPRNHSLHRCFSFSLIRLVIIRRLFFTLWFISFIRYSFSSIDDSSFLKAVFLISSRERAFERVNSISRSSALKSRRSLYTTQREPVLFVPTVTAHPMYACNPYLPTLLSVSIKPVEAKSGIATISSLLLYYCFETDMPVRFITGFIAFRKIIAGCSNQQVFLFIKLIIKRTVSVKNFTGFLDSYSNVLIRI